MNDPTIKDITEILLQKRDLVSDMLRLTESTRFFGDEEDADKYISLMDKRQSNIEKIISIDKELEQEPFATLLKNPTKELEDNIYSINHAIREFSGQIIELDKANSKDVERIMASLKKELKGLKEAKSINSLYQNDRHQSNVSCFDTKK